jgi:hypothetical protein
MGSPESRTGSPEYRRVAPPGYAGRGTPAGVNRYMSARPAQGSIVSAYRQFNRNFDRSGNSASNRDRFEARRRSFANWYFNTYPAWLGYGYPYLFDPGFYDWGDSGDYGTGDYGYDQGAAAPYDEAPYPQYGDVPDQGYAGELPPWNPQLAAESGPISEPVAAEPLTVVFKSGRAPMKMQNYMMTAKILTDLDSQHYERIPVDQIDIAATQQANASAGIEFQIPRASRD